MGSPVDETRDRDAQPIGDEEPAHDERADEANAREGEPAEAAALEADDDEYEMVDPSELVDVRRRRKPRSRRCRHDAPADVAGLDPPAPARLLANHASASATTVAGIRKRPRATPSSASANGHVASPASARDDSERPASCDVGNRFPHSEAVEGPVRTRERAR